MTGPGRLWVVGTPIGNLGDLSSRAAHALRGADVIACEDTRRTGRLLELCGLPRSPLVVVNDHTEAEMADQLVDRVRRGAAVALVTDAGMPGVSDPGAVVVRAVLDAGLPVEFVPGPSAALLALVASGLPANRFVFEGFLPRTGRARADRIAELATEKRTAVLFESPHRVGRTLTDLVVACGRDRPVAVARELTKLHEEIWRGTLGDAAAAFAETPARGEVTIVIGGAEMGGSAPVTDDDVRHAVRVARQEGLSRRDAAASVAEALGVSRRRAYDAAIELPEAGTEGSDGVAEGDGDSVGG